MTKKTNSSATDAQRAQRIAAAKARYRSLLTNTSADSAGDSDPARGADDSARRLSADRPPHWEDTLIRKKK